jgi:high-affinity nickel-transport protein
MTEPVPREPVDVTVTPSSPAATASWWDRLRRTLTPQEWRRAALLVTLIAALHLVGFGLLAITAAHGLTLGSGAVFGFALGITAYTLGARHAFDADHIAAIDNTTRKLVNDGQRPLSVGFFFSLGHSTIVFLLAALLAIGIRGLSGAVKDESSALQQVTGAIGPTVAGVFLVLIGILNLIVLVGIVRVFLGMRRGRYDERELERQLDSRGLVNRFYRRATRAVSKPWHMYPVGLLFGLGFDTATEIALLATAGTAAAGGLPLYGILSLPILFAAGMSLLDTIDGALMNFAYHWAFLNPVRKVFYNIAITALSVLVALVIGPLALISVLSESGSLPGGFFDFVGSLDLHHVGYAVVGMFVLAWGSAVAVWRFGRIEERWSASLQEAQSSE